MSQLDTSGDASQFARQELARADPNSIFVDKIVDHAAAKDFLILIMKEDMPEELDRAFATHPFEEGSYYRAIGWTVEGVPRISVTKLEGDEKAAFLRDMGGKVGEEAAADEAEGGEKK